jgi:hypothetical protein
MPREAITAGTSYIDAVELWREIRRELPSITADVVARTCSSTIEVASKGVSYAQVVRFDSTACNFGNSRLWILCPGCKRRVRILYLPSRGVHFLCRLCHDLTYESCNRSRVQRLYPRRLWVARKIWGDKIV